MFEYMAIHCSSFYAQQLLGFIVHQDYFEYLTSIRGPELLRFSMVHQQYCGTPVTNPPLGPFPAATILGSNLEV